MTIFKPHEIIPSSYHGREQAYIKHLLLEGYLERLLYIIGWNASQLGYSEVVFVDCFAGPWQDESSDLSSTSIGISLRLLSKIQTDLSRVGRHVIFTALFVERNKTAYGRLREFLKTRSPANVSTDSLHGDFVEKIPDILERCAGNKFAFFFIDPKGWIQIKPGVLKDLLMRPSSEFLINFMYDFINRTVSMSQLQEEMAALFDRNVDCDDLPDDPVLRENYILQLYRSAVVSRAQASKYQVLSGYVTILDPTADRTKYHLIYLTRHPLGIIEFMTQSEKMATIQMTVRAAAKMNKKSNSSGIDDLFGIDDTQTKQEIKGNLSEIEEYWLTLIGKSQLVVTENVFANILSHTDRFPSELQEALKNLIDQGLVLNLDGDVSRRKKNFVDYKKSERLQYIGPVS